MVNMIIDGKQISAEENITIMEAAERNGIPIPKLCYLKGINEIAACRVCVVELEGKEKLITSCNNMVKDGMVIYTNSPKVRNHRRNTVQLLLSQHDNRCVVCPRNGNCQLQQVACDLNILDIPFRQEPEYQPWDKDFPLIRNSAKCIKCMRCVQVCDKIQGLGIWDVEGTGSRTTVNVAGHKTIREADCALCGQCITHCPVGALSERDDTEKVWEAIENKDKIVVAQVAPAVRAAWGEELGLTDEDAPVGKIFDALKRMGVDYAFDTVFSADLTIMEESTEFIKRFTSGELKERPMFTSCCPGWVRFVKTQFPYMVNYLSTAKSPQQMFGAVMKTYFAEKLGVSPDQIFTLSIMPCVAKKENPPADAFKAVRSGGFQENAGVQEAEFAIGDIKLRTAAVSGLGNTRRLLQQIERGEVHYDFVEVMACPGGCVGGGGQPIHDGEELAFARGRKLYALDAKADIRYSHENPDIREIYSDFFGKPMSHKAHMLLHTEHWKNN